MRYVALILILFSLPVFVGLLRQFPTRRPWALVAIGAMLFFGGSLQIDAALITWPFWNGIVRGVSLSPVDTLALALLVTRARHSKGLAFKPFLAFYGLTLTMSLLFSAVPMATFFECWQYLRLLVVFFAVAGEIDRPERLDGLLAGLSLGLMLQAGYVILQKLSGVIQAPGTMSHQNTLGMMTELALLPLIAAVLGGDRRLILKVGTVAGLVVVVGGGSRAAMAMAGGGIAVLAVLSLVRQATPVKLKMIGLGALALTIVVPLGLMTLQERFGSQSIITQETQRAAFERAARAMSADHPFGVGANMYVPTANTNGYAQRAGVAWNTANRAAPVHNAYLLTRAETGWTGELAYILLFLVPMVRGLRLSFAQRKGQAGEVALGSAIAMGVLIIHNNYEFAGLGYEVFSLALLNAALVAGLTRYDLKRPPPKAREARVPAAA